MSISCFERIRKNYENNRKKHIDKLPIFCYNKKCQVAKKLLGEITIKGFYERNSKTP